MHYALHVFKKKRRSTYVIVQLASCISRGMSHLPGSLDKKTEGDAIYYIIKDDTFFLLFCLTNPAIVRK
jgi:hypothetical protein